jgi:hypothetical protein
METVKWVVWDIRDDGRGGTCTKCSKSINGASVYVQIHTETNPSEIVTLGKGCIKKFTGQTLDELKVNTEEYVKRK